MELFLPILVFCLYTFFFLVVSQNKDHIDGWSVSLNRLPWTVSSLDMELKIRDLGAGVSNVLFVENDKTEVWRDQWTCLES